MSYEKIVNIALTTLSVFLLGLILFAVFLFFKALYHESDLIETDPTRFACYFLLVVIGFGVIIGLLGSLFFLTVLHVKFEGTKETEKRFSFLSPATRELVKQNIEIRKSQE